MPVTSPNMNMPVPIVGQETGPDWATDYNACLSIIDQHDHTSGKGIPLTQDSLSLTAASPSFDSLSFNTSNAYALRSVRFTAQSSALALVTDVGCLYEAGVDLYYNDGSGNQIRLTQGGSIVGTSGSISGLPSGTASASYSGGTFVWQAATATAANMDAASYIFRNSTASSKGLTLSPPNAMASDYALVLPALPASTKIMALDTSGNITAPYSVDNSTITISSNVIGVPAGGIETTQLANGAVTQAKRAALGQQISSSGGISTTSTTYVDVTNLSCTITTTGRLVWIGIIGTTTGSGGTMTVSSTSASNPQLSLQILRDSTAVYSTVLITTATAAFSTLQLTVPSSSVNTVDAPAAGTYTYKVQIHSNSASVTASISNSKLLVYEL